VSGVTAAASVDASNEVNRCVLELSSEVKSMTWVFMPFSVAGAGEAAPPLKTVWVLLYIPNLPYPTKNHHTPSPPQ
jgi:hypothetical protein